MARVLFQPILGEAIRHNLTESLLGGLHVTAEDHVWTGCVSLRTIPKELERQLSIVDDDEGLTQYRYGTDLSVLLLVL
jgi:hypothetical protein